MLRVETISMTNPIKGRELFYLRFIQGENNYVINVGKGTFEAVKDLIDGENKVDNVVSVQEGGTDVLDNKRGKR